MMYRIAFLPIAVPQARGQTVYVASSFFKFEIAEHVIERAVLHQQNDDIVDLAEIIDRGIGSDSSEVRTRPDSSSLTPRLYSSRLFSRRFFRLPRTAGGCFLLSHEFRPLPRKFRLRGANSESKQGSAKSRERPQI